MTTQPVNTLIGCHSLLFDSIFSLLVFRMVFAILAVIVLVILGLVGWCIYRFCKKKRPKKDGEKDPREDDENALVENEEVKEEDVRTRTQLSTKNQFEICFVIDLILCLRSYKNLSKSILMDPRLICDRSYTYPCMVVHVHVYLRVCTV